MKLHAMNECLCGHTTHKTRTVPTIQGPFVVYDTRHYAHCTNYCPGHDAVSENLALEGQWEPHDTPVIQRILAHGDRNRTVIDFGAHCGWFSIMAAEHGYHVLAIDADAENLRLLEANAHLHDVADNITIRHAWVDEDFTLEPCDVELVKIDLEGNDRHAVAACMPFIDRVNHLYIEVSPVFNNSYPRVVKELMDAGFEAWWPDGRPFDDDYQLTQFNLRFSR